MANKKRLLGLVRKLIAINSENPPGNEREIALFVRKYLSEIGVRSRIYEFRENRANLVAVFKGKSSSGRGLLISPHLDTVPAGKGWKYPPFAGKVSAGRIYGLGATDCKGNLAVCLEALRSLVEAKAEFEHEIIFAATADEESGSCFGLLPLLKKKIIRPGAALIVDSGAFNLIVAQKGLIHLKVKIYGRRSHGAYPWMGVNAIEQAVEILRQIKRKLKFNYRGNPYLRAPSVNIGTINGGDKVNIVADYCEFELDIRFLPRMDHREILANLKRLIASSAKRFSLEIEGVQPGYSISKDHPLVECFMRAARRLNVKARLNGSEGATTISFFKNIGVPAVAVGFGVETKAHSIDEYARIDQLYKGARVMEEFIMIYRG